MRGDFTHNVTLYNRVMEQGGELWRRTPLQGVEVMERVGEAMRHSGAASSSARRVGPVSVSDMTVLIPKGGRSGFLSPIQWRGAVDRTGCWTLQAGDLLVPGICLLEVEGGTAALLEQCERVAVISTVTDYDGGDLAHWEVTAR